VCLFAAAAHGQWLEDSICIADTFSGLEGPCCLAHDSVDNSVFVAGEGTQRILVLDAADGRRLGWVPFAGDIRSLCYNPISNRVYAPDYGRGVVAVIDAGTRQVIETLGVGSQPYALAFNATMNRVYCANRYSDDVTVIDGEGDSVVATIDVGERPEALCWNPTRNVVYSAGHYDYSISVIDATTDTVINTIDLEGEPAALLYNPDLNRLYVASQGEGLVVVDGLADTALATLSGIDWPNRLCYNPAYGKVYIVDEDNEQVVVVDCLADSLLGYIDCGARDIAFNPRDNRLYMIEDHGVVVADGPTDSLLWEASFGYDGRAVCVADFGRRVFCTADEECLVGVFDCAGDSLLALVGTDIHVEPSAVCVNPTANKAYCTVEGTNEVMVIDGADNAVRRVLPVGWGTKSLLHSSAGDKVYCANSGSYYAPSDLTVIDGSGDSILRTIETGPGGANSDQILCLNPAGDRLYEAVYGDNTVIVFDAVVDTIVCRVPLPTSPYAVCYGPAYDYVYAAVSHAVDVIDAAQNIMIAEVDVGSQPVAICYVPVGDKVYTADEYSGTVSVIAGERPERVGQIGVGGYSLALAWDSHDSKVYCAVWDTSVVAIDASADTLVARVPVGRYPRALSYDSVNDYLYTACQGDSVVVVVDCHRDSVIATIHVGANLVALAWNPIALKTYAACCSPPGVWIIRDSLHAGIEGQPQASGRKPQATVIRGVLYLPRDMAELGTRSELPERNSVMSRAALLDIGGRKVMDLRPDANDVRSLAPGVYFVRSAPSAAGRKPSAVTKIVITR